MLTGPFKVLRACWQSSRILKEVNATAVLGMGGFVSGPVGLAAIATRRPLVLHEQNAVVGMANKWLSRLATRVFSAVPDVFPANIGATAVGNPVRESIEAIGSEKQTAKTAASSTQTKEIKVLIIGGSSGARALNEMVPAAVQQLSAESNEFDLHVWHQTGPADEDAVNEAYASVRADNAARVSINVQPYIDEVTDAYQWADVIICRSGAMTVSEISAAALPGLLVPYPYHSDNQQARNARFLSDAGAAVVLPQAELTAGLLAQQLRELAEDPDKLNAMSMAAHGLHKPDAANIIADALQEVGN